MTIPRDLEELLSTTRDIDIDNIDATIGKNVWTNRFRDYLQKRDLNEELQMLKFLLRYKVFLSMDKKVQSNPSDTASTRNRAVIFRKILVAHFNDDGDDVLPMSNSDLSEALCEWTRDVSNPVTENDVEMLKKASEDATILSEGMEPCYSKFVKHYYENQSKLACLLSII